jgi:hypothetical protein
MLRGAMTFLKGGNKRIRAKKISLERISSCSGSNDTVGKVSDQNKKSSARLDQVFVFFGGPDGIEPPIQGFSIRGFDQTLGQHHGH